MPYVADDMKYSEIRDKKKKTVSKKERRLLVKHEDSKRDDFCNDLNFGFFSHGFLVDCRRLQAKTRCSQILTRHKHKCGCFHQNAKRIAIRHETTSQK